MTDASDFLYPFIESGERDATTLLVDLARSADAKAEVSSQLRATTLTRCGPRIDAIAVAIVERAARGHRLLFFGNGGSSTDAASLASLFADPPSGRPVPALALGDDGSILTALGNDVGFDLVFSRQVIAHGRAGDVAVGLSTSGNSRNLLNTFETAARRGLLTVGFAGYAGGRMATSDHVHHCLVVEDDSVHRIQETQCALGFEVWQRVQEAMARV